MTTPVEKRNHAKFCEFHGEVGHNTDECMHLKKQIEEMLKAGKLSHLIKEIKHNNKKEQPKAAKKGETSGKDKALAILMPTSSRNQEPVGASHHPFDWIQRQDNMANRANTTTGKDWRRRTLHFGKDEFCGCKVTISVQYNYWKTRSQKITSSSVDSSQNAEAPGRRRSNYFKEQQVGPAEMCDGLWTRMKPFGYHANSGRKNQGGNKSKISRINSNYWLHPHRGRPQQVVRSAPSRDALRLDKRKEGKHLKETRQYRKK
ncbi:hypothetical protein Tco_0767341 [Tanacetum coccineum]